jgi:hypothetical protein
MKTEEGKLKDKVKAFLNERGAYYHMPVPSGYGSPTLDFVGCYRGYFFAIETKAPGKRPTPRQCATMQSMQNAGGCALWGSEAGELIARMAEHFNWIDGLK